MTVYVEVVPAYGRDYANQAQIKKDWNADKDFQDPSTGRYLNRSDATNAGLKVIIRYAKLRKVMAIN